MKFFKALILMLFLSCSSTGGVDFDRASRATFAAAGAFRTLAADPSFLPSDQENFQDAADALVAAGRAIESAALISSDESLIEDKIAVAISALQQAFIGLDPETYEEYRPYFITAQVLLSVVAAELRLPEDDAEL